VLFNMLALWMFGMDLERDWGTRRFLKYYFFLITPRVPRSTLRMIRVA
jgi:membrane associated rhomboid family serine protease